MLSGSYFQDGNSFFLISACSDLKKKRGTKRDFLQLLQKFNPDLKVIPPVATNVSVNGVQKKLFILSRTLHCNPMMNEYLLHITFSGTYTHPYHT